MNRTRASILGSRIGVADRWWLRARGFLRRPEPVDGEGLLLSPCRAVHMVGMGFALDVLFVDRLGRVLAVYPNLAPGRRSSWYARARYALELPVGTIEATGTAVGDHIAWLPVDADGKGTTPFRAAALGMATAGAEPQTQPVEVGPEDTRAGRGSE